MMSATRGRLKSSAQGDVQNLAHEVGQGVPPHGPASKDAGPPHGTASREEQKHEQALDQKPAVAQDEPTNLMDVGNDMLILESNLGMGGPVHADNQLPPQQEEEIEEVEDQVPFSSHEGEEEEDGALREGDQEKKKRKRDAKYESKHPKD